MTKNLDLEIRKALNSKIEVEKFMLFTVKVDSETKIDFKINKDPNHLTVIASYEQSPQRIEHTYKNVTITYSTWSPHWVRGLSAQAIMRVQYAEHELQNDRKKVAHIFDALITDGTGCDFETMLDVVHWEKCRPD